MTEKVKVTFESDNGEKIEAIFTAENGELMKMKANHLTKKTTKGLIGTLFYELTSSMSKNALLELLGMTTMRKITEPFAILDALRGHITGNYKADLKRAYTQSNVTFDEEDYLVAYDMDCNP